MDFKILMLSFYLRRLYRPENLGIPWLDVVKEDINKLYWTESKVDVNAESIEGLCFIMPRNRIEQEEPSVFAWSQKGSLRFFYDQTFNTETRELEPLTKEAENYQPPPGTMQDYPLPEKPLNMLDVFAGCGGLSIGIEQSGLAEAKWAIEWEPDAAEAYKVSRGVVILLKLGEPRCNEPLCHQKK